MNVRDLITLLENAEPDAEVLLATQPSWPLQFNLAGIFDPANADLRCDGHDLFDCPDCEQPDADDQPVIYLVEGGHPSRRSPYAPRAAWELVKTL